MPDPSRSEAHGAGASEAPALSSCLYLGRAGDADTHHLQPHAEHRCFATAPESRIALPDQRAWCFGDCEACVRYVAPVAPGRRGAPRIIEPPPGAAPAAAGTRASAAAASELGTPAARLRARLARFSFEEWLIYGVTAALLSVIAFVVLLGGRGDELAALPPSLAGTATAAAQGATRTPTPRDTATPRPTREREAAAPPTVAQPSPPSGGLVAALAPGERGAGSFSASARLPAYGERELRVGSFDGDRYIGGLLFSLSKIPPSSRVSYVALELAGLSDSQTLPEGEWTVELLDPEPAEGWADLSYATLLSAPATQMRTAWRLGAADLAARKVNVLEFSPDALDLFAQRLAEGRLAFRILGPEDAATDNLFIWDTGYGEGFGTRPVLRVGFVPPTATPTPPGRSAGGGAQATPLPLVVWIGVPTAAPAAPTPTPYPMALYDSLRGKILFVSDRFAVPEGAAAPPAGFTRPAGLTQPEQLMVYDPATGRLGQVTQTWPWTLAQARSARGADLTVSVGERTQIVVRDRYSEGPRDVGVDEGDNYDPAVSPDGEWIVFVSNRHHNDEIYTMRRDGAMLRRLTENDWAWDKQPSFSPDGGRIVFWSNRDGNKQLYIMNADGTEQRNVSNNAFNDWAPVWVR